METYGEIVMKLTQISTPLCQKCCKKLPKLPKGDPKGSQRVPRQPQGRPKGTKRAPRGTQGDPRELQGEPTGAKRGPKGPQRVPKGSQRLPKSRLLGVPWGSLWGPSQQENLISWISMPSSSGIATFETCPSNEREARLN